MHCKHFIIEYWQLLFYCCYKCGFRNKDINYTHLCRCEGNTRVQVDTHTCSCPHGCQKSMLSVLSYCIALYLRQGFFPDLKLTSLAAQQGPWNLCLSIAQCWGQRCLPPSGLLHEIWGALMLAQRALYLWVLSPAQWDTFIGVSVSVYMVKGFYSYGFLSSLMLLKSHQYILYIFMKFIIK
jgi:hypothetical protein